MFAEKNKVYRDTMGGFQLTEGMKSWSLNKDKDKLFNKTIIVRGFLITRETEYGRSVLLLIEPVDGVELLYLPERYVEEFRAYNDEEIDAILNGHMGLTNFRVREGKYKPYVVFDYVDK